MRTGFGCARADSSASANEDAIAIVGRPLQLPAGDAPALQTEAMLSQIFANSSGSAARSLRIFGRRTEFAIGARASQIPCKSLSDKIARIMVARSSPKISRQVWVRILAAAGLCAPSMTVRLSQH